MRAGSSNINRIAICVTSYQSTDYRSLPQARQISHRYESANNGTSVDRNVRDFAAYFQIIYVHPGELIRLHDCILPAARSLFPIFSANIMLQILMFIMRRTMNRFETSPWDKGLASKV